MFYETHFPNGRSARPAALSLAIHVMAATLLLVGGHVAESMPARVERVQLVAPHRLASTKRVMRAPKPIQKRFSPPPKTTLAIAVPVPLVAAPPVLAPAPVLATVQPARVQPRIVESIPIPAPPAIQTPVEQSAPRSELPARVEVRTGEFGGVSSVTASANRRMAVSTDGFGDAALSAANGGRGAVSASGFGDASAATVSAGNRASTRSGGFGDVMTKPAAASARWTPASAPVTAAQILDKPRPVYTEEARRLQIQGEVQIELIFGASGEIHILRVVQGLGHGLDENAVHAAKAIRFLPAKRDGRAVDSTAMVHIIFQLAS